MTRREIFHSLVDSHTHSWYAPLYVNANWEITAKYYAWKLAWWDTLYAEFPEEMRNAHYTTDAHPWHHHPSKSPSPPPGRGLT